ncbi:MAG: lipopolysaccharide biosynthesis protein [Lachnospiraceae bacterium]
MIQNNREKIERSNYIWNAIAGVINASEAVILLMVLTRTNSISDAGILSLSFAVASLLLNVGKYGMRNYQVTDSKEENSFNLYFSARLVTTFIMLIASILYIANGIFLKSYSNEKAMIVFVICVLYMIESIEDIFIGFYQRKGRLAVGTKIFSYRWGITLFVFSIILIAYHNLLLSACVSTLISGCLAIYFLHITFHKMGGQGLNFEKKGILKLLQTCMPLFVSEFCIFYITNSSKYAIDKYLSDEVQACYGFIVMPSLVIGLVSSFVYQPELVSFAQLWRQKKLNEFTKKIKKQILYIIWISIACLMGAYAVGTQVLSILYNTFLGTYRMELLVLLLGGGLQAIAVFLYVMMTIMRVQKKVMLAYIGVAICTKISAEFFVQKWGIMGAAINFTLIMFLLVLTFIFIFRREYQKVSCDNIC